MYTYKDIWKVSVPVMLGLLAQNVVQFTDMVFLGYVGKVEQSAAGLAGIYYIAFFTICFGFSIGSQILISRRNGERNYDKIGSIVVQGALFLLGFALLLFAGSRLMTKYVMANVIDTPEVMNAFTSYMDWRLFGLFFSSVNVMFRAFYVGIAKTKVLTITSVIMAVVNFVIDYLLIFGNYGFPELGVAGASIAAVISEIAAMLFFLGYTRWSVDLEKYGFKRMKFKLSVVKNILKISSFTMVQNVISTSTWFLFFLAIQSHSVDALAVTNIVRNFYMIYFIAMSAFATAANTLVGNTMGAGRKGEVIPLIKRICKMSVGMIAILIAITAIAPEFFISLIAPREDLYLIPMTVAPLTVVLCILPICSISNVIFSSISGTGNTKAALILEAITLTIYVLYMIWIVFIQQASVAVCWTVELVYWGGLLTLSIVYLRYAKWYNKVI